ncbi:MAG: ADP-glyceromanno-heptose 6-epimerase [Elusimicrobiota bacterium]
MIIVTGGAGFIGSALIWALNEKGIDDILVIDHLEFSEKWKNLTNKKYSDYIEKDDFLKYIDQGSFNKHKIDAILHMGACSNTQEHNASYLIHNNFEYTKKLAEYAVKDKIRFIYASSAATYGSGNEGYSDASINDLEPLNMYGYSKHMFDLWAERNNLSNTIVGLKYFNVFGPNESHKGDMRSLIHKAYAQINETGKLKLFKSYREDYKHGEQKRDFIYIKDAVKMTLFFLENDKAGIFNIGTGKAKSWNYLAGCIFDAMNKKKNIQYVDMPDDLIEKYQYFTEADISKIMESGFSSQTYTLKDAVTDYIQNYLSKNAYL